MNLLVQMWQAFADNATHLMFQADEAPDERTRAALEWAAQHNMQEKARLEAAMMATGTYPDENFKWDE